MDIEVQPTLFDQQMKDTKETETMTLTMLLKLNAPGLTSLHKAGLAGLYMTLRTFEKRKETIDGLEWQLQPQQVILPWTYGKLKTAFEKLIEKSFWIDEKGFIRLSGLELEKELSFEQRHHLYNALLNSFLQYGRHRTTVNKQTLTYEVDEKLCWIKDFAPVKSIRQQGAVKDFINSNGNFEDSIEAAGWLFPGAVQRHVVHNNTKLNESPETALLLLFAPVGVVYYMIIGKYF